MNILDEIVANTRAKVSIAKEKVSIEDMISTIHSTKIVKSKFKASYKDIPDEQLGEVIRYIEFLKKILVRFNCI